MRGWPRRQASLRTDTSSWAIRSTSGICWSAGKILTEIVSLWTSSPRWMGATREILATAGSFRMLAPPASVWVIHEDADRSRPFHADYGCRAVHGQDHADGRAAAEGVRVAAGVELDPEVRLADPQPRDLENPDVALEALRLDGAEGGLVEIHRLPASATDSHGASLADQVMASVSR